MEKSFADAQACLRAALKRKRGYEKEEASWLTFDEKVARRCDDTTITFCLDTLSTTHEKQLAAATQALEKKHQANISELQRKHRTATISLESKHRVDGLVSKNAHDTAMKQSSTDHNSEMIRLKLQHRTAIAELNREKEAAETKCKLLSEEKNAIHAKLSAELNNKHRIEMTQLEQKHKAAISEQQEHHNRMTELSIKLATAEAECKRLAEEKDNLQKQLSVEPDKQDGHASTGESADSGQVQETDSGSHGIQTPPGPLHQTQEGQQVSTLNDGRNTHHQDQICINFVHKDLPVQQIRVQKHLTFAFALVQLQKRLPSDCRDVLSMKFVDKNRRLLSQFETVTELGITNDCEVFYSW